MTFTVHGLICRREASVTWLGPDELEGDAVAVMLIRFAVENGAVAHMMPLGGVRPAQLVEPFAAMKTIIEHGFDRITAVDDQPEPPTAFRIDPNVII